MADTPLVAAELPPTGIPPRAGESIAGGGPAELPIFRFGLRQLFWFIAVVSTLLAAIVSAQGVTALALLLAALVVAAHILSTAIGSQLRSHADQALAVTQSNKPHDDSRSVANRSKIEAIQSAARSPWHGRGSTALPWLSRLIAAGALAGGTAGGLLLFATIGHRTSLAGIVVGSISLAVLGGWFAFLGGSFYGIFRHGVREALAEQRKDESRHNVRAEIR
jgi:hypothetical protein